MVPEAIQTVFFKLQLVYSEEQTGYFIFKSIKCALFIKT